MVEDAFDDDDAGFGRPLPRDDRIWRHPSEVGGIVHAARRRREVSNGKLIGFAMAAGLLGSVITVGALTAGGAFERSVVQQAPVVVTAPAAPIAAGIEPAGWPEIVRRLDPSLARVEATGGTESRTGTAIAFSSTAEGTYLVTSRDLVLDADKITLVLTGERRKRAELIGSDRYTNLAVLHLVGERLDPAPFSPSPIEAGSDAIVVSAGGSAARSAAVAKALVGSVDNTVRTRSGIEVQNLLRTDAHITPDAKGGALVDASGSLIGVILVMATDETGVERFGYALPSRALQSTADSLIRTGFPTRVWLGISGSDLPAANAAELAIAGGAVLDNVAVDSPAAQCGLRSGDVVTKLNVTPVESMTRLVMILRELRPTDTVAVEYVRAGAQQRCFAALSQPPEAAASGNPALSNTSTTTPTAGVPGGTAGSVRAPATTPAPTTTAASPTSTAAQSS